MFNLRSLPTETVSIEYKLRYTSHIGNSICAFLNTIGGTLYIGIDENGKANNVDGHVEANIKDLLETSFCPNPSNLINVKKENLYGNEIVVITVSSSSKDIYSYNGFIYFRQGDINRRISENKSAKEIITNNRRTYKNLPVLKDYIPSDSKKRILFEEYMTGSHVSYKRLGEHPKNTTSFYKYIDLDTVLMIFRENPTKPETHQTLRFVEPPKWDDQFESRFYYADYHRVTKNKSDTPKLYATCFTPKEESEPAWISYNKYKDGLGKRCVQFRLNQIELRKELIVSIVKLNQRCTIIEGSVIYLSKEDIRTLHLSTDKEKNHSSIYDQYFSDFTLANYINLLLLKRQAFEHEREVRIFLIYDDDMLGNKAANKNRYDYKDLKINWLAVLEGIKVSSDCTQTEIDILQDTINNLIDKSNILDKDELKEKLKVRKFNINEDTDRSGLLLIGETYDEYVKRNKNQ